MKKQKNLILYKNEENKLFNFLIKTCVFGFVCNLFVKPVLSVSATLQKNSLISSTEVINEAVEFVKRYKVYAPNGTLITSKRNFPNIFRKLGTKIDSNLIEPINIVDLLQKISLLKTASKFNFNLKSGVEQPVVLLIRNKLSLPLKTNYFLSKKLSLRGGAYSLTTVQSIQITCATIFVVFIIYNAIKTLKRKYNESRIKGLNSTYISIIFDEVYPMFKLLAAQKEVIAMTFSLTYSLFLFRFVNLNDLNKDLIKQMDLLSKKYKRLNYDIIKLRNINLILAALNNKLTKGIENNREESSYYKNLYNSCLDSLEKFRNNLRESNGEFTS